jgi:hypothetical protein
LEEDAILMIGDGMLSFTSPRRCLLLWEFGPESYKRATEALVENTRL